MLLRHWKKLGVAVRVLLTVALTLAALLVVSPVPAAAAATVDIQLEPAGDATPPLQASIVVGSTFTTVIKVYPNTQLVAGVDAFVNFDPVYLEVVDADPDDSIYELTGIQIQKGPSSPLTNLFVNQAYNTDEPDHPAGTIDYCAGKLSGTPPSATFTLATITFRAMAETPAGNPTALSFNTSGTRATIAAYEGNPVQRTLTGASITIVVLPPVAAFHASAISVQAGTPVNFTDDSTNTPTSWAWDFVNSGGTPDSTLQNPSHTYTLVGFYSVKLIATNSGGSDDELKLSYITVTPGPLHHINITPTNLSLQVTGTQTLTAEGKDQYNNTISGLTFAWSCTNPTAGSIVSGTGAFTAGTVAGTYANVIQVQSGAVTANTGVTVTPGALQHIHITPTNPSVAVNGTQTFTAEGQDQYHNAISGLTYAWTVTNATAGSIVGGTGAFTAGTVANTYANVVQVQSGAVTANTGVTVTPGALHHVAITPAHPQVVIFLTQTFTAAGYDQYNNVITGLPFGWSCTNATAGSIDGTTGVFTASGTTGDYIDVIVAQHGPLTATASVEVIGGILDGTVTLQGTSRPAAKRLVAVTIRLHSTGLTNDQLWSQITGSGALASFTGTTVDTGTNTVTFQIVGLTPGTYDITIQSPHTLVNVKKNRVITGGTNAVSFATLLEGNCNDDRQVNALDFSILASAYLKAVGAGYDARADFDGTGQVNSLDFSMLASAYLKAAPQTAP